MYYHNEMTNRTRIPKLLCDAEWMVLQGPWSRILLTIEVVNILRENENIKEIFHSIDMLLLVAILGPPELGSRYK
jgi:hypothetical protein